MTECRLWMTHAPTTTLMTGSDSGYSKYSAGVKTQSGKVVFVPSWANSVGVFDPSTNTFTAVDISGSVSGNYKYRGGCEVSGSKVVFVPSSAASVLRRTSSSSGT